MILLLALLALAFGGTKGVAPARPGDTCRQVTALEAQADAPWPDQAPRHVALLVGVQCYEEDDLNSLIAPQADVALMRETLEARGFAVVSLSGWVERADVLAALDRIEAAASPDTRVWIYWSGHGALGPLGRGYERYLMTSDTLVGRVAQTGTLVGTLSDRLAAMKVAERVLFVDSCHAAGLGGKSATTLGQPGLKAASAPVSLNTPPEVHALFASDGHQLAREQVTAEVEGYGLSLYTWHFARALADADLDGDGSTGMLEAHLAAAPRVAEASDGRQVPQYRAAHPRNLAVGEGLPTQAPTRALVLPPRLDEVTVTVDGQLGATTAPVGRAQVQVSAGEEQLLDARLPVSAGSVLDLDRVLDERAPVLLLGIGGAWAGGGEVLSPIAPVVSAWRGGRQRSSTRWWIGALATAVRGPAVADLPLWNGQLGLRVGPTWRLGGGGWELGPTLGLTGLLRLPPRGPEGALLPVAGLHLRIPLGRLSVLVDPTAGLTTVDGTRAALLSLPISLGVSL